MLTTIIWLLLTGLLSIGQLAMALQTDWLVHGFIHQGLYALCYYQKCQWRQFDTLLTRFIFASFIAGNLALLLSIFFAIMAVTFVRKNAWKWVYTAANFQFFSVLFFGSGLIAMPFDMVEIYCTTNELLKSMANCRIGWPYAIACILCLMGMCCPIIGKLVVDQQRNKDTYLRNCNISE